MLLLTTEIIIYWRNNKTSSQALRRNLLIKGMHNNTGPLADTGDKLG